MLPASDVKQMVSAAVGSTLQVVSRLLKAADAAGKKLDSSVSDMIKQSCWALQQFQSASLLDDDDKTFQLQLDVIAEVAEQLEIEFQGASDLSWCKKFSAKLVKNSTIVQKREKSMLLLLESFRASTAYLFYYLQLKHDSLEVLAASSAEKVVSQHLQKLTTTFNQQGCRALRPRPAAGQQA